VASQLCCRFCERALVSFAPDRVTVHGAMSIHQGALDEEAWIECPECGHETPTFWPRLGVNFHHAA
jgi:hypothetical protein